jgi:hypothetical protein
MKEDKFSKTFAKHGKHISPVEREFLAGKIGNGEKWNYSSHVFDKVIERGTKQNDIFAAFNDYAIVEYHTKANEPRILIRDNVNVGGQNICLILAPISRTIITAYFNDANDNHRTLDMTKYTKKIDVIESYNKFA